ncbi:MAG: hypothetical protein E2590_12690 [Chryseobacterium sp.]|nr:hypothetical protein [Chryseobacterium sp.]
MATLKKLMTLLSQKKLIEQRAEIIREWTDGRTTSAKELTDSEIITLCEVLEKNSAETLDKKRKRVIAAIFGIHKEMNKTVTMDYVKAIACRMASTETFNQIPPHRLDSIYNAALKAKKDLRFTGRMVAGFINEQQSYN